MSSTVDRIALAEPHDPCRPARRRRARRRRPATPDRRDCRRTATSVSATSGSPSGSVAGGAVVAGGSVGGGAVAAVDAGGAGAARDRVAGGRRRAVVAGATVVGAGERSSAGSPLSSSSSSRRPARRDGDDADRPARASLLASHPGQSLLHHADHQPPVGGEDRPAGQPAAALVDSAYWSYSSHSSARNGRWNHIAWSRLAIWMPGTRPTTGRTAAPSCRAASCRWRR